MARECILKNCLPALRSLHLGGAVEAEEPAKLTESRRGSRRTLVSMGPRKECALRREHCQMLLGVREARIGKRPLDFVSRLLVTLPRAVSLECGGGWLVREEDSRCRPLL